MIVPEFASQGHQCPVFESFYGLYFHVQVQGDLSDGHAFSVAKHKDFPHFWRQTTDCPVDEGQVLHMNDLCKYAVGDAGITSKSILQPVLLPVPSPGEVETAIPGRGKNVAFQGLVIIETDPGGP